jgi:predicted dehydrogenase
MSMSLHRRQFIKGVSASLALSAFHPAGNDYFKNAASRRVALIGTGWYGKSDLFRLMQVAPVEVVALCDADQHLLSGAAALIAERKPSMPKPRLYTDYRKLFSENKLDIALIGSPDHWHALQAIAAMQAGAHVFVQKPISADVIEGEAMVAAARKYQRVVQAGTQRRSTPHLLDAKKNIVDAGLLGKISHVEMCCYYHMRANGNPPNAQPPAYFDYEMWTGPAPMRPFDILPHVRWWRTFMEYGNGIVGDMCIHMFDAVRWMLHLGWPKRISSTGGIYVDKTGKSNISDTQSAIFEYDDLNCVWQHRSWGGPADPQYPWSFKLFGEKGTLSCSTMQYDFVPEGKGERIHRDVVYEKEKYPEDLKEKDIELNAAPAMRMHMLNFLHAIDTGTRPVADIEEAHISTASCILANLSMKLNMPLSYDPQKMEIRDNPEANMLLRRKYREPWIHPEPNNI